jgi:hypothetical protein
MYLLTTCWVQNPVEYSSEEVLVFTEYLPYLGAVQSTLMCVFVSGRGGVGVVKWSILV